MDLLMDNLIKVLICMARITSKNIVEFQEVILTWYNYNGRNFPWRKKQLTQYQIIVAEILLQRTKAETVSGYYKQFIKEFPNWEAIAIANISTIERGLKPIGLQRQKAARIKKLALEMIKRKGRLPNERHELESIPFFGQYISNAIELLIKNKPTPLIDVNMARVLERYFGPGELADIRFDNYLQKLSFRIVNHSSSIKINWAILDFAALVCKPNPLCNECRLKLKCNYFNSC